MDELIHLTPDPPETPQQTQAKYDYTLNEPEHSTLSSRQVQYNIPIFTHLNKIIHAKPTHDTLTYTEERKAGLIQSMYEEAGGKNTVQQYLSDKVSNYELLSIR